MNRSVYVVGLGVISAIGNSLAETMKSFQEERDGILFDKNLDSIHCDSLPVGTVPITDELLTKQLKLEREIPRTALLGIHAARQALQDSGVTIGEWNVGIISATTVGGMDRTENFYKQFLKNKNAGYLRDVVYHECGSITECIATDVSITDFVSTINTACSSSINSIILGARMIRAGMLDVALVGGADAITRFTLNGFNSLMILDKNPCRPLDASRAGLNLGEGAGFMVLASEKVIEKKGITVYCKVSGFANTNDAFHQTASSPEGVGPFLAMEAALAAANLDPSQMDYINLHGTGTENNDRSEGNAVSRLFGSKLPYLSSTKSFTGHTLGASGGIESVFSILALTQGCVFPSLRFQNPMPELNMIPQQKFVGGLEFNHVLNNSFGFGGNCSSIIFSKV